MINIQIDQSDSDAMFGLLLISVLRRDETGPDSDVYQFNNQPFSCNKHKIGYAVVCI